MTQDTRVTSSLARLAARTRWSDLPLAVRHQAKRSMVNFFAVTLGGCRTAPLEILLQSLAESGGRRAATVIGRSGRVEPLAAAFLNAASANVFDFCDTHVSTAIHPTAPIAAAALALGESRGGTGASMLLGLVVGQEVACRIGLAISPQHYARGWHITSTCGVFGAAAAAGSLLALEETPLIAALGIASTLSSGLCECLGTGAKSVGVGSAARNGLWSALLAAQGMDGPAEPLNGAQGWFHALAGPVNLSLITAGLGETWEILKTSYKPYPCGFVIHPVLDCVLDWRRDHAHAVVEHVSVHGNPLLSDRTDRPLISTGRESQVSVQHAVAAALVFGKAGLDEFTDDSVRDPRVAALRGKVSVLRDPAFELTAARVDIDTTDGTRHVLSQAAARGSDANPMTDAELEGKLRIAAAGWDPRYPVEPLIDALWTLDECADVSSLLALARCRYC